jgi:hypothetical protein
VWSHVEVDARGTRPDQIHMLVNGLAYGVRSFGMSRLSAGLSLGSPTIPLESADGFPVTPDTCVIRSGDEVIEVLATNGALSANRFENGRYAGFGGRMAREPSRPLRHAQTPGDLPANMQQLLSNPQQAGTTVELSGYSTPLASSLRRPSADARGDDPVPRGAARGRRGRRDAAGRSDPSSSGFASGAFTLGFGLDGPHSRATGSCLASADASNDPTCAVRPPSSSCPRSTRTAATPRSSGADRHDGSNTDHDRFRRSPRRHRGHPLRGWNGTTLLIAARGDQVPELQNLLGVADPRFGGRRAFVANWDTSGPTTSRTHRSRPSSRCRPTCSRSPSPSRRDVGHAVRRGAQGNSAFAQFTEVDAAERTEWVRYDWFETGTRSSCATIPRP